MQSQNQIFEDFARLMSSLAGTMAGAGREAEAKMKEKLREAVGGEEFVSRDEFDALKAMVLELRREIDGLKGGKPAATIRID